MTSSYIYKEGVWYNEKGTRLTFFEKIYLHIGLTGLIKERGLRERCDLK